MCRPVTCKTCGKITWSGCGLHVGQIRAGVPSDQWCGGHATEDNAGQGFLRRLLGRR